MKHETRQRVGSVADIAEREGHFWGDAVSKAYFDIAESALAGQWAELIGPLLEGIRYEVALDLASGHGRNAQRLAQQARRVYCVDINPENIKFLKRRFASDGRFMIFQNDGASLPFCDGASVDLFYCFDAMVHFDLEIVQEYIRESYRILRRGAHAFIHCSNYTGNPGGDFRDNPHWRNFMSFDLFTHLAKKAGFSVVRGIKLEWGGVPELDAAFLLRKE